MKINPYQIIRRPVMTEKTQDIFQNTGKYVFEVDRRATKQQIKRAIPLMFGADVKVAGVNILFKRPKAKRVLGNPRRRNMDMGSTSWIKRAVVTLKKDSRKIELL